MTSTSSPGQSAEERDLIQKNLQQAGRGHMMDELLYLNQKKDFQKKNHSLKEKNKLEEASTT